MSDEHGDPLLSNEVEESIVADYDRRSPQISKDNLPHPVSEPE